MSDENQEGQEPIVPTPEEQPILEQPVEAPLDATPVERPAPVDDGSAPVPPPAASSSGPVPANPERSRFDKSDQVVEEVKMVSEKVRFVNIQPAPRGKIYDSILHTIGGTPLVRVPNMAAKYHVHDAEILVKLEYFNPSASMKDRIALSMIEAAEAAGDIEPGKTVIIEPTSGNTGVGLAMVCAAKGYKLILVMPESMSIERRKLLIHLGAELRLTPAELGMRGTLDKAQDMLQDFEFPFIVGQFDNPGNPDIHAKTTAEEIWADTGGEVDIFVTGVGTGGSLTGVGTILKERKPDVKVIAVEPDTSAVLSGEDSGGHKIQGIGAGFIPDILDQSLIDGIVRVKSEEAYEFAKDMAKTEGIACGISSGAAIFAAIEVAKKPENAGKKIVTILPSFAERYFSTDLFETV